MCINLIFVKEMYPFFIYYAINKRVGEEGPHSLLLQLFTERPQRESNPCYQNENLES